MSDKTKKIREYFEVPKPKFSFGMFIAGVILFFVGIEGGSAWLILGGLGVLITSVVKYITQKNRYEARPSDEQMDEWLEESFLKIINNDALDKLGLDHDELVKDSLVIPGPVFWEVAGISLDETLRRLGADDYYRYSVINMEVFVFTEHYLANYGCVFNQIKDTTVNEHTNEFFYKDVVSVRTDTQSSAYTLKDGEKLEHSQIFQLNLPGDQVTVVINDNNLKTNSKMTNRVDKAVQSIRAMLREKKS